MEEIEEVQSTTHSVSRDAIDVLLRSARLGNLDDFRHFVETTSSIVLTYIRRYGVRPEEQDDIFQEIYLAVFRHLTTYDPARPAVPWLLTITRNAVHRYSSTRQPHSVFEKTPDIPHSVEDPHRTIEAREALRFLSSRMTLLPIQQREVLALAATSALTIKEISELLGMPESTAKTLLYRGRATLAHALAEQSAKEVKP